ncbi:MAG: FtsX-like permease family protein, partial [Bryobacteraceae bacterium]
AEAAVWAIVKFRPVDLPRLDAVGVDLRVLFFTLAVAVLTSILFGLAPAIQMLRADVGNALQQGSQRSGEGMHGNRMRGMLVALEFALSMILLIGAVLLTQTFVRLRNVDPGFNSRHLLTEQMALTGVRYETAAQVAEFARETLARVQAIPGVVNAAATNYLPLTRGFNIPLEAIEGRPRAADGFLGNLEWFGISPQFFDAMDMRLARGREFEERDTVSAPPVVIVNEAFARKYFPDRNALGQRILIAWNLIGEKAADQPRQIIGVVNDIHEGGLQSPGSPDVFVPLTQVNDAVSAEVNSMMPTTLLVRTAAEPMALSRKVADAVHSVDAMLPVFHIRSMTQVAGDSIRGQRFLMTLLGAFALLALVLAAIGVYGVMSYAVAQRTREIGIRAALGARPADLLRMIAAQGMTMALLGLAAGTAGALALTQLLRSFLYGVTPRDAPTFVVAALLLAGFALLATLIPALRAARLDPAAALRRE